MPCGNQYYKRLTNSHFELFLYISYGRLFQKHSHTENTQVSVAEAEDIPSNVGQLNSTVQEVFCMFKTYPEEKIEEKGRQLESKSKAKKEVIKLKYKGNQKQYEFNPKLEDIFTNISKENDHYAS